MKNYKNINMAVTNGFFRYGLLPVWLVNTTWNGKTYTYAMNGHTGKLYGEVPISYGRVAAFCGALFAVVTPLIGFLGGLFL